MGAAVNGLAYHGGFIPFGATFLVFSDYMRPAIRLAALSRLRSIFVFTHDSIGLGEDGPTHQPVEQLAALRAIPEPARDPSRRRQRDARRLAGRDRDRAIGPTALVLTRQAVPTLDRERFADAEGLRRGAYVLDREPAGAPPPDVILIAQRLGAVARRRGGRDRCARSGDSRARGVDAVLAAVRGAGPRLPGRRAAAGGEGAGRGRGGDARSAGTASSATRGAVVGVDRFGASAPGDVVMREYGFTPEHVADVARGGARVVRGRRFSDQNSGVAAH